MFPNGFLFGFRSRKSAQAKAALAPLVPLEAHQRGNFGALKLTRGVTSDPRLIISWASSSVTGAKSSPSNGSPTRHRINVGEHEGY